MAVLFDGAEGAPGCVVIRGASSPAGDARERRAHSCSGACRALPRAEGIVPGGGIAFVRAARKALDGDEAPAARILRAALEAPLRALVENAGAAPQPVIDEARGLGGWEGWDAVSGARADLRALGIIEPARQAATAIAIVAALAADAGQGRDPDAPIVPAFMPRFLESMLASVDPDPVPDAVVRYADIACPAHVWVGTDRLPDARALDGRAIRVSPPTPAETRSACAPGGCVCAPRRRGSTPSPRSSRRSTSRSAATARRPSSISSRAALGATRLGFDSSRAAT